MPRKLRLPARAAALAGLIVLGGCGGDGGSSAGGSSVPDLPPIEDPKQARSSKPCTLLADEALRAFGLGPGESRRHDLGPQCVWRGAGERTASLTLYVDGGGLAALATESDPAASRVRVAGYPALETFTEGGTYCRYDVAIAEAQAVVASMSGGDPDSCTALHTLLGDVLTALPNQLRQTP